MFKTMTALLMGVLLSVSLTASAVTNITAEHFEGGQNLNKGHRRGADKTLGELIVELQTGVYALTGTISNGDTTHAPTGDAVFDALALKADYAATSFSATFTQGVGAKTVLAKKVGKLVSLEIPTGSTADGGGGSIASGATDVPAGYRPAATLSWPVVVSDNGALVFGKLTLTSAGLLTFTASAAGGNFTDDAAAGFDRVSISYHVP